MIRKTISVLLAVMICAGALAATGISSSAATTVYRVDLTMPVPESGTKTNNVLAVSQTPNVSVVDTRSAGTPLWYTTGGAAYDGYFIHGQSYLYVILIKLAPGYSAAESTGIYLNGKRMEGGQAYVDSKDGCVCVAVTFRIEIGEGDVYVNTVNLNVNQPRVGDEVSYVKPTVATAGVSVFDSPNNIWDVDGVAYKAQFETGRNYYYNTSLKIEPGYYVDDNTTYYLNGVAMKSVTDALTTEYCVYPRFLVGFNEATLEPYTDVPADSWYTDGVAYCAEHGYMSGTSAVNFRPGMTLTRAQFVTVLARIDGADVSEYKGTHFTDVPEGKWFSAPVEWAYQNGYAGGTGNGMFSPDAGVTRETLAVFMYTYSRIKFYDVSARAVIDVYTDVSDVSGWAKEGVQWAIAEGLIAGTSATTISPKTTATRAQVSLIVKNYIEKYVASNVTVTFNAFYGQPLTGYPWTRTLRKNEKIGKLPVPVDGDRVFEGWYILTDGGAPVKVSEDYVVTGDVILTASWAIVKVTFDPDIGECEETQRYITIGQKIGTLPVPTGDDALFAGWSWVDPESGETVFCSEDSVFYEPEVTLKAVWIVSKIDVMPAPLYRTDD